MLRYHGPARRAASRTRSRCSSARCRCSLPAARAERREIVVRTAFGGPGARDGFELVTRAVTEGRYTVDAALARPERGRTLERFVFQLAYRERAVTLVAREGSVPDELIALARTEHRSAAQEARFAEVKRAMAEHVMASAAADVYDAAVTGRLVHWPLACVQVP